MKSLPASLATIFTDHTDPETIFNALMPSVCDVLQTDRCFLEVRNPQHRLYRVFCWRRSEQFPDMTTDGWQKELPWELEDPLYAAALRAEPSIFVEDVETASPDVLNIDFEHKNFGHRALIHAHICEKDVLRGILQPCVFNHPRIWSESDRAIIDQLVEKLKPFVVQYGDTKN
jgi:GAF domain-containing protein